MSRVIQFSLIIISFNLFSAVELETYLYDIEESETTYDLLSIQDGRVYEVDKNNHKLVEQVHFALNKHLPIKLLVTESDPLNLTANAEMVISAAVEDNSRAKTSSISLEDESEYKDPMYGYEPTNIITETPEETTMEIFKSLYNRKKKGSQCYNRAYVWANDMHQKRGIKSKKNFVFYSKKFRREIDKKWWFHVAPIIMVNGEEVFVDRAFSKKPLSRLDWETVFIGDLQEKLREEQGIPRYSCPMIDRMSIYDAQKETDWCFHLNANMYFWGPNSLYRLESKNVRPLKWHSGILKTARKQAFKKWRQVWY
ncbi:protein-glutamine glutaminase family protein [Bacteriovoracaceae bacterium]|nr:protein-glutamine glutaminase family protein [Bacteriovoracaceae bacterium]